MSLLAALAVAAPAQAATGTSATATRTTGAGTGFDIASAPSTAVLRAWSASPYRAVNIYFSGTQRYDTTQTELGSNPDWVTTALANGWALIPTVVDLQPPAPCYGGSKQQMSTDPATAAQQGAQAAAAAHADLGKYGIAGTVAYLDLEPFDVSKSAACAPAVLAFVHAWVQTLHSTGERAGIYVHWQRGAPTFVQDYDAGSTYRPDDIWVAQYDGNATAGTAVLGSRWLHHRIHQYWSDDPSASNPNGTPETYGSEQMSVDRDALDGDVVTLASLTTPTGPPYVYYASGIPSGSTLKHRAQPTTSAPYVTTSVDGDELDVQCQATGETVDGDYVWDRLTDGTYVSDLYTTTTGRNWVSAAIQKCDTTPPTVTVRSLPLAVTSSTVGVSWTAADAPDPDGNPNGESRGISSATVRYRYASWHGRFSGWHTLAPTTARSVRVPMSPGYDYCITVQVRDLSGNASAWSPQQCVARALDDRSLAASRGWVRRTGSKYYLHTVTTAASTGVALTRTKAQLARVGLVATTCSSCGAVKVYVGRHYVGTISLHTSATHYRKVLLLRRFSLRSGTVTLRTINSHRVQVDGLVVSRT